MSIPRPEHPKMQFYRPDWVNLNGEWSYEFDFGKSGIERGPAEFHRFCRKNHRAFCPESPLSGVGHTDFIESMFYQRALEIAAAWNGRRILLHFGAVDYTAVIYLDGVEVGRHSGGSISFTIDLTRHVEAGKSYNLVVHVLDDQRSFTQPFGKQCPKFQSCGCSYTRVTGIWQTVWLEAAGMQGLKKCRIVPEFDRGAFGFLPSILRSAPAIRWSRGGFWRRAAKLRRRRCRLRRGGRFRPRRRSRHRLRSNFAALRQNPHGQRIAGALLKILRQEAERPPVELRHDPAFLQSLHPGGFEPDGLPNAGHAGIAASARLEFRTLLAEGLGETALVIEHMNDQIIAFSSLHMPGQVDGKGDAAAGVTADFNAVQIDHGGVIDCAEVEQNPPAVPCGGNFQRALVEHAFDEVGMADAGERAFRAERHGDFSCKTGGILQAAFDSGLAEIKFIAPLSVQVDPIRTVKLHFRVFGTRNRHNQPHFFLVVQVRAISIARFSRRRMPILIEMMYKIIILRKIKHLFQQRGSAGSRLSRITAAHNGSSFFHAAV